MQRNQNKEKAYVVRTETFEERMRRKSEEAVNNRHYKHKCFELVEGLIFVRQHGVPAQFDI